MEAAREPRADLARKSLPKPLYRALSHIFDQGIRGCMLVGGTALAGFYAGHRRSDDLDLFTRDEASYKSAVLAVKSLGKIGARFVDISAETSQYYRATLEFDGHHFTVDVVLDPNVFRVGSAVKLENNIHVADLKTLLMTKAATLVSRCGEKDLYDLIWLFRGAPALDFAELIRLGHEIDAGVSGENVLLSLSGSTLAEESCDFALSPGITRQDIHQEIIKFRRKMIRGLMKYLEGQPAPPLRDLVERVSRLKKR